MSALFRWALVAVAFVLWLSRFDYGWGYSDQDETFPLLLHLLDDNLLAADWYVQTQAGSVGVRTYFVYLVRAICIALPPELAVGLLFVLTWASIAFAITRMTQQMGGQALAMGIAVVGSLCMTPKWTLGGNDLVYAMLVPEMLAWALALPAIILCGQRRFLVSGLLLGIATCFQVLAGLLTALLLIVSIIVQGRSRDALRDSFTLGVAVLLTGLPILIPVMIQQLAAGLPQATLVDATAILTEIRAPHHYLPSAFPAGSWMRLGLLVVAGFAAARYVGQWSHHSGTIPLRTLLSVIGGICLTAWFFSEVYPVGFVVKLQLFKLTVYAKLLSLMAIGVGMESLLARFDWLRARTVQVVLLAATLVLAGGVWLIHPGSAARQGPRTPKLESWVAQHTPRDALFLVPPSRSSFRSHAQRAIVVDYAAFPFRPGDTVEWYRRMTSILGVDTLRGDSGLSHRLDSIFHSRGSGHWRHVADQYAVDYLVQASRSTPGPPLDVVYRDSEWVLYRIRRGSETAN